MKDMAEADVIVCGGGPAGVAAAVAAARAGAKVQLLEAEGALGGTWSLGFLSTVSDMRRKTKFIVELEEKLTEFSATPLRYDLSRIHPTVEFGFSISPEWVKVVMEQVCLEAGVRVRLYSPVMEAERVGARITAVKTASKSGVERWSAEAFVDASGDGDLAALAGCAFEKGNPENGRMQPMSMHVLVCGVDEEIVRPYIRWGRAPEDTRERRDFGELLREAGVTTSYGIPGIHQLGSGLFLLGINHEYEPDSTDADARTRATMRGRAECLRAVAALRRLGGAWGKIEAAATSSMIGVREGRRVRGLYTVGRADLLEGRRQPDAVCRVTFPVDIHSTSPEESKSYSNGGVKAKPYDIPLRAQIAADVDNLLLAGRCISGNFVAHASYRVVGNALALGESAGVAAALCARNRSKAAEVSYDEVFGRISPVADGS